MTPEKRFHLFQFNWGYVESSRIVPGPLWLHREGFDTALEALASFRQAIQSAAGPSRGCPEHLDHPYNFCPQCGTARQEIPGTPDDLVKWFDDLWKMACVDLMEYSEGFRVLGWEEIWEYDITQIPPSAKLLVSNTQHFLLDEGGYVEARSEDESYSWNSYDDD